MNPIRSVSLAILVLAVASLSAFEPAPADAGNPHELSIADDNECKEHKCF